MTDISANVSLQCFMRRSQISRKLQYWNLSPNRMVSAESYLRQLLSGWVLISRTFTWSSTMDLPAILKIMCKNADGQAGMVTCMCHAAPVLFLFSGCTRGDVSDSMKQYCSLSETTCRRSALFINFPGEFSHPAPPHSCCDACALKCACECVCSLTMCVCAVKLLPSCKQCCQCDVRCSSISSVGLK